MTETFYHVDQHGELEVGDTMRLEWPPQIKNNVIVRSSESNTEILKKEYPNGLSRHGSKYALSALVTSNDVSLSEGWEAMSGEFNYVDTAEGVQGSHRILPYQVQYEWMIELVRRAEFEESQSRFQGYFASRTLEEAEQFIGEYRADEQSIFKVHCEEFEIRDMDLINTPYLGIGYANGRKYWNSEPGSESPTWEVVMEPPIEVVERV